MTARVSQPTTLSLRLVRIWLPIALMIAGAVVVLAGGVSETAIEIGVPLFSAGASWFFLSWLFRVGVDGDVERHREQAAREYFAQHGRWPDER